MIKATPPKSQRSPKEEARSEKKTDKNSKKGKKVTPIKGRPTKLTKEVQERFTDAVAIGSGYELASRYARVSVEAAALWMRKARNEMARREAGEIEDPKAEIFITFLMAVRDAEAEAGVTYQQVLHHAAVSDPQWAHRMLRTRFPSDYMEINTNEEVEIPADMEIEFLDRIIAGEAPAVVLRDWKLYQREQRAIPPKEENVKTEQKQ